MKRLIALCGLLLVIGAGCSGQDLEATKVGLVNTYRDAHLLFQIGYPKDWVVTDYVDYELSDGCVIYKDKGFISAEYGQDVRKDCGKGTKLTIANYPTPYQGWSLGFLPPIDYVNVGISVLPKDTTSDYANYIEKRESSVEIKAKYPIGSASESTAQIIVYGCKDESKECAEGIPTAVAYYYGDNYTYEFSIPGWGPATNEEIDAFKKIVSSFEEIR